jgi:L-lactate dehydrogenase complex protein LldE
MLAEYAKDAGLAEAVAEVVARTYDISELLVDVLGVTDVGAYFPHRVTYHPTCHSLRVAKVGDRPYQLLSKVKGLELLPLDGADQCCGFGGTFSVKNPDVSVAMGSDKARHVTESGAEYLITGDNACLMHIGGLLHRQNAGVKTIHLAEVLASTESGAA